MPFSTIRTIKSICAWGSFIIGTGCNVFLISLIRNHTPQAMRVYSKILLQTSILDLLVLTFTVLNDNIIFTADGGSAMYNNGLVKATGPDGLNLGWLVEMIWMFLIYVSLFGFVAQYIYRYLTLTQSISISTFGYIKIFAAVQIVPFIYVLMAGYGFYPPADHKYLKDQTVADLLGLNVSDGILLVGYDAGSPLLKYGLYYNIVTCTLAYVLMIILGWCIHRFIRLNLRGSKTDKQKQRTLDIQRQLTRVLIIQVILPATIYIPLVFLLIAIAVPLDLSGVANQMQWYNMLSSIPMYLPSAVNPFVVILLIRDYRHSAAVKLFLASPVQNSIVMPHPIPTISYASKWSRT